LRLLSRAGPFGESSCVTQVQVHESEGHIAARDREPIPQEGAGLLQAVPDSVAVNRESRGCSVGASIERQVRRDGLPQSCLMFFRIE